MKWINLTEREGGVEVRTEPKDQTEGAEVGVHISQVWLSIRDDNSTSIETTDSLLSYGIFSKFKRTYESPHSCISNEQAARRLVIKVLMEDNVSPQVPAG
jgi:hypothetical protein